MKKKLMSLFRGERFRKIRRTAAVSAAFSISGLIFTFSEPKNPLIRERIGLGREMLLRLLWMLAYIISGFLIRGFADLPESAGKQKSILLLATATVLATVTPPLFVFGSTLFLPFSALLGCVAVCTAAGACIFEQSPKMALFTFGIALIFSAFFAMLFVLA